MAGAIDRVFIEIVPDLSKFDAILRRDLKARFKEVAREAKAAGDEIEAAFTRAARSTSSGSLFKDAGVAGARSIIQAFNALPPQIKAVIVAGVAAATPFVGALLGAAVIGGAGGLGLAGGIAAAAQDQRVKTAAGVFAATFSEAFGRLGSTFVQPVLAALSSLTGQVGPLMADFGNAIAPIRAAIGPLVDGLLGLFRNILPGFSKAIAAAVPLLTAFANELPRLGTAISDAFATIAEEGEGATLALIVAFRLLGSAIRGTAAVIAFLSGVFENIFRAIQRAVTAVINFATALGPVGIAIAEFFNLASFNAGVDSVSDSLAKAKENAEAFGESAGGAGPGVGILGDAIGRLNQAGQDLIGAQLGVQEALDRTRESLKDNGATLKFADEAGRANVQTLRDAKIAFEQEALAIEKTTGNSALGAQAFQRYSAELFKNATQAGLSEQAVRELFLQIGLLPPTKGVEIKTPGVGTALQQIEALRREIEKLKNRQVVIDIDVRLRGEGRGQQGRILKELAERDIGFAAGGPVRGNRAILVGEEGPEIFVPSSNGRIVPNSSVRSGTAVAGGGGVNFFAGAIAITFAGVVPTAGEATRTGEAVGMGISGALARRNTRLAVRTV